MQRREGERGSAKDREGKRVEKEENQGFTLCGMNVF